MTKNQNKEHWTKSAWAISIGTAIFSLLLTIIYDYSKEKAILTTVWEGLKWVTNLFRVGLNFNLKVWWIIVAIVILLIITNKFKRREAPKPSFYNYRKDKLKKWTWTWGWKWDSSQNAWVISNMEANCPKCNTPMIDYSDNAFSGGWAFDCPRCEFNARNETEDIPYKIERIILDNVNRQRTENTNSSK